MTTRYFDVPKGGGGGGGLTANQVKQIVDAQVTAVRIVGVDGSGVEEAAAKVFKTRVDRAAVAMVFESTHPHPKISVPGGKRITEILDSSGVDLTDRFMSDDGGQTQIYTVNARQASRNAVRAFLVKFEA